MDKSEQGKTSQIINSRLIKLNSDQLDPQYEKSSEKMADLARNYHERLQKDNIEPDEIERECAIKDVLETITTRIEQNDQTNLAEMLSILKAGCALYIRKMIRLT